MNPDIIAAGMAGVIVGALLAGWVVNRRFRAERRAYVESRRVVRDILRLIADIRALAAKVLA